MDQMIVEEEKDRHRRLSQLGLALGIDDSDGQNILDGPFASGRDRKSVEEEKEVEAAAVEASASAPFMPILEVMHNNRRRSSNRTMMHIDTSDPGLDAALKFVSRDPLADLSAQMNHNANPLSIRRRGRAIYLNDLLEFSAKAESSAFSLSLSHWHDKQGDDDEWELDSEEEQDFDVLLAQARSLAQKLQTRSNNLFKERRQVNGTHARHSKKKTAPLETSASTPEGALGKLSLPHAIDFRDVNWDGRNEEISDSDSDVTSLDDDSDGEVEVLRAGLRFTLGCYDDLVKKRKKDGVPPREHSEGNLDDKPYLPIRTRSRSRSLIKTLTNRSYSHTSDRENRLSAPSSNGHDGVLDIDSFNSDQIAGPSSRYGMVNMATITPPAMDQGNPNEKLSSSVVRKRSLRRSSDATPMPSPAWSRRPSKLETPSEQEKEKVEAKNVSHSSLVSALQQMRKMDRGKSNLNRSMLTLQVSPNEADEMIREERIKNAALMRELETLKASFSHLEKKHVNDGRNSIEMGANSDEEAMMMQAVTQAARDTVEAEERESYWKDEYENTTERIRVVEEALFQAMGLLAGREGNDQPSDKDEIPEPVPFTDTHDVVSTMTTLPNSLNVPVVEADISIKSGASSPFYSAGEEDEDDGDHDYEKDDENDSNDEDNIGQATIVESQPSKAESSFAATMEKYSRTGSEAQPFSNYMKPPQPDSRGMIDSQRSSSIKVSGWDQNYTMRQSDGESQAEESMLPSPRSSISSPTVSRRDSYTSRISHSNPPPPSLQPNSSARILNSTSKESKVLPTFPAALALTSIDQEKVNTLKKPTEKDASVSLYASVRSAIADEKKSVPFSQLSHRAEEEKDEAPIMSNAKVETRRRNSSAVNTRRRSSKTDTVNSSSSSSSKGGKDKSRPKVGHSKTSILGHMPPSYSPRVDETIDQSILSSSASIRSSDTQPSSISNGITEHYEKLAKDRSGGNNNNNSTDSEFFSRRTRFAST